MRGAVRWKALIRKGLSEKTSKSGAGGGARLERVALENRKVRSTAVVRQVCNFIGFDVADDFARLTLRCCPEFCAFDFESLPPFLPPLPFALVAVLCFCG